MREREERLRVISDDLPGAVAYQMITQPNGTARYTYISAGVERLFGLTPASVMKDATALRRLVAEEDRPRVTAAEQKALRDLGPFECEFRWRTAAGEIKWVHCRARTHPLTDGSTLWNGLITDITARKELESEAALQELRFRMAQEAAEMVTWEWDIATGAVRYSENISSIVRGPAVGPYCSLDTLMPELHPEDRGRLAAALKRTATEGSPFECEYRVRMLDGSYRWILGKGKTVVMEEGKPVRVLGLSLDVTERKQAEEKLRQSEALYRAIGESIDYGVWMCASDGRNIYASDSFLKLVGMTQEQCSNFGWGDVLHPADAGRTIAAWKECVLTEGKWDIEHRFRGVDGQWHPILARGVPVKNERGEVICWAGINLDISRLKQTEQALQEAQAKLQAYADELEKTVARRTAKLQETVADLEHLSYAITHDMRAPLRAMQGFATLLDEECGQSQSLLARDYSRRIRLASERLDRLITDALNYGETLRREFAEEPVDLGEFIRGLVETYPNLQPDKASVEIVHPLPVVMGNKAALTQCFSNLLGNAVKFAKPAHKPEIRIRAGGPASPTSAAHDSGTSSRRGSVNRVRVWVEDSGIGIPKDCQERIFNLYERATTDREGTGIGLAIVRKVVERMGGQVGVESEEGKGSKFWVDLRLAQAKGLALA